jgi:spermidine synthase
MTWYFLFFFISGFCGILYELIWLRLAMAQFGVTTPLVSTVLSAFMGGLGAGSWLAGRMLRRNAESIRFPPLRLYALTELLIGCSAFVVPLEFEWGHHLLQSLARSSVSSVTYYIASGALIAVSLVPWCALMGATIPCAMFSIQSEQQPGTQRSFSFLYLSNVVGAIAGASVPLLLIENWGFRLTLRVGALLNFVVALLAMCITLAGQRATRKVAPITAVEDSTVEGGSRTLALLFLSGLTTMGMEVVWIRLFTVYLGPLVYSFALIMCSYLFGTFIGACWYRDASDRKDFVESKGIWMVVPLFGSLPLLLADPRLPVMHLLRPLLAIAPFAASLGYLTPMLVDRWAKGDADRAGHAYAINVLGCIAGPLLCGFVLLPLVGEHFSVVLLVLPWIVLMAAWGRSTRGLARAVAYVSISCCLVLLAVTKDYGILFNPRIVLRDSTATVTATGTGMRKQLLVNGIGMTMLQPATKMMAHLTLASLTQPPDNVLVICFGMGTTQRSVVSWGVASTAVELVPSVPKLFPYYHPDGLEVLASPFSHLVVDDGRRYLERSTDKYDAIIIDPPPPVRAASSSLLYSKEFYAIARKRLAPTGIVQQWLPTISETEQAAVVRALSESFPYVRVFPGLELSGWHFLASMQPIPFRTAQELAGRMPDKAVADMLEWGPAKSADQQFDFLLQHEMSPQQMIALSPDTPAVQDDRPVNEYFLMRSLFPRAGTEREARRVVRP